MLILSVLLYVFLIFPLFLSAQIFFLSEHKKLYFVIKLFGIKLIGGYAEQIKEGFAVHITKNYALIIPYKSLFGIGTKIKPLKDYHFIKLDFSLDIGSDNLLNSVSTAFMLNYVYNHFNHYLSYRKPYVLINNEINVYDDKRLLNVSMEILILFNFLMIVLSLIKILVEKIIYAKRNK